jgi:C_GCAxxG_C_C family probable redox protein
MSKASEKAVECFNGGFSCSQAVLASHCGKFGMAQETAFRVAGAFGGGMGHIGGACGAVTGALMLIGLKYGKFKQDDTVSKDRTYEAVAKFVEEFKRAYGSLNCTELVKFDLSRREELLKAREAGVFKTVCPALVKGSIELVEKYLD